MCDENDSDLDQSQDHIEDILLSSENLTPLVEVTNLVPPPPEDTVTMTYVDNLSRGLEPVESVMAATSLNIELSTPVFDIDGYHLQPEDRILLLGQLHPHENGIYIWNSSTTLLERSYEFRENSILDEGAFTFVERGFSYSDVGFVSSTRATIGRDPVNFMQFNAPTVSAFQREDAYMFLNFSKSFRDKWFEIKELYESVLNDSGFDTSEVTFHDITSSVVNEKDVLFSIKCESFYLHLTIESFVLNKGSIISNQDPKYTYNYSRGSLNSLHYEKSLDKLKSPEVYESIINWLSLLDV